MPGIVRKVVAEKGASCLALANLPDGLERSRLRVEVPRSACCRTVRREPLPGAIDRAHVGITGIVFGIAQTGTLVEVATNDATRLLSALPRTHIGVVRASELVEHYDDAAPRIRAIFNDNPANCVISFLSGPSRTGDIELKLTLGVHGPESAHAIIILE